MARLTAFARRLTGLLTRNRGALSRNRNFYTFANPEGRRALKLSRRLRELARAIVVQVERGHPVRLAPESGDGSMVSVELELPRIKARRRTRLTSEELEILLECDEVRHALGAAFQPLPRVG